MPFSSTPELAQAFIAEQVDAIREQVGDKKVLLALSGGVDSSVVAALFIKAIGKQLICVHVNHGLMRKGESEQVVDVFENQMDANLVYVDATDRFVWAAELLSGMGYTEINLNLGCPSGTVVAKEKGSGLLRNPTRLEAFLSDVCERSPLPVSVKTRVGIADDVEYDEILELFCRCGIRELIVHPRVQKDFYSGKPRRELYGRTLERAPFPVAYNGDVFAPGDYEALVAEYPQTRHVLLGRGILANPALARQIRGGAGLTREELERFPDELYRAYTDEMGGNAVFRMKEWWSYARCSFADPQPVHRAVRKLRRADEYEAAVRQIFATELLADEPRYS